VANVSRQQESAPVNALQLRQHVARLDPAELWAAKTRRDYSRPVVAVLRCGRKKHSSKYSLNVFALLNTTLDLAVAHDLLVVSPLKKKLHKPTGVTSPEKQAYTAKQILSIVEHIPEEHRLLIVASIMSALRAGELLAFRWCDLRENVLSIEHSIWRRLQDWTKTAKSKQRVAVPPALAILLGEHRQESAWNRDEDFIFTRSDGRPHDPDLFREQVLYPALKRRGARLRNVKTDSTLFVTAQVRCCTR
jgi:integrase